MSRLLGVPVAQLGGRQMFYGAGGLMLLLGIILLVLGYTMLGIILIVLSLFVGGFGFYGSRRGV
jgi:predicted cobalt transporter CbtA